MSMQSSGTWAGPVGTRNGRWASVLSSQSLLAFSTFCPMFITLTVRLVLLSQVWDRHCQVVWSDSERSWSLFTWDCCGEAFYHQLFGLRHSCSLTILLWHIFCSWLFVRHFGLNHTTGNIESAVPREIQLFFEELQSRFQVVSSTDCRSGSSYWVL